MEITAVFESWHIGDGNYPPLHKGQSVSLSFELEPKSIGKATTDRKEEFLNLGNAAYRFRGKILKVYENEGDGEILILESNGFRFYILSHDSGRFAQGETIVGEGALLLDHYIWVEFLHEYNNPPDLFHNLTVKRIRRVRTPERFITRHDKGKALPTRLSPPDYSPADVEEIETMVGQAFDEEFYIIDFDSTGVEKENLARTFIG